MGGEGEGPGEFQRLTSVHEASDGSILALDFWLGRITRFSADGRLLATHQPYDPHVRFRRVYLLDDDRLIGEVYSLEFLRETSGLYRMPFTIIGFDVEGGGTDTLMVSPASRASPSRREMRGLSSPRPDRWPCTATGSTWVRRTAWR